VTTGFTITELAELSGMTARNIRAHQSRGLLPAPRLVGRVAYYDSHHVARLALIRSLQLQGYSLAAITRVIAATDSFLPVIDGVRPSREATDLPQLPSTVPLSPGPELDAVEQAVPGGLARLVELGMVVHRDDGPHAHFSVAGLGGRVIREGVPLDLFFRAGLAAAELGHELGSLTAAELDGRELTQEREDTVRLFLQLLATVFELGFAHAAGLPQGWAGGGDLDAHDVEGPRVPPED
jgi:DNA-binding transcriptional MerR regulator